MRNVRITVSYDGTGYHGFQIQPGLPTVQEKLTEALRAITGEEIIVIGSGRTDAGVHARGQVINFHTSSRIPADRWCMALNAHLPSDIVAWAAEDVPESFHARKSSKRKTYCYRINASRYPDPMTRHMELHHPGALDFPAMESAIRHLEGTHDFTSFCSVHTETESKVRTIYEARIVSEPEGRIRIMTTGNGFLYNMVRIIAGTLIAVGQHKLKPETLPHILEAMDRSKAGPTAKAHGLTLWEVDYE